VILAIGREYSLVGTKRFVAGPGRLGILDEYEFRSDVNRVRRPIPAQGVFDVGPDCLALVRLSGYKVGVEIKSQ